MQAYLPWMSEVIIFGVLGLDVDFFSTVADAFSLSFAEELYLFPARTRVQRFRHLL
mgnify:FL=1